MQMIKIKVREGRKCKHFLGLVFYLTVKIVLMISSAIAHQKTVLSHCDAIYAVPCSYVVLFLSVKWLSAVFHSVGSKYGSL